MHLHSPYLDLTEKSFLKGVVITAARVKPVSLAGSLP
jgi:hypothetical protein